MLGLLCAVVLAGVYDAFVNRLVEATRSLRIGPAEDPSSFVGPVIDDEARQRILRQNGACARDARLVYSADLGERGKEGYDVPPPSSRTSRPTPRSPKEMLGPSWR